MSFVRSVIAVASAALLLAGCVEPNQVTQVPSAEAPAAETRAPQVTEALVLEVVQDGAPRRIVIGLRPDLAPRHVERVKQLASEGFYNGIVWHRVIPGFMAQTGDPTGTGAGGSKYPDLPAEFTPTAFGRGTVGAARTSDPNSANSQFFICFGIGCSHLQGQYTVWGQVQSGMEFVDKIKAGAPGSGAVSNPDRIQRAFIEKVGA
ncbi:MAG: peptidylprolyl isomerase [Hyphomicrobiaceae bacterium]